MLRLPSLATRLSTRSSTTLVAGLLIALNFSACGGGGSSHGDNNEPAPPSGLTTRPSNSSCVAFDSSGDNAQLTPAFAALNLGSAITSLTQAPGTTTTTTNNNNNDYWYVTTQDGVFARIDNNDAVTSYTSIGGLPTVAAIGEGGLLSAALHPRFASNHYVYLSYTTGADAQSLVSHVTRYTLDESTLSDSTLGNALEIITLNQPAANHNGGHIAFGPDGYLYIGFGDGGGGGDTYGNGQNPLTFHSKILRIDVDGASPYRVPDSNPFVGDSHYLPEIFAQGFRNPWQWSFDGLTNELWVGDVGQNTWEEVDRVQAGNNYGWPVMEGNHCYSDSGCSSTGFRTPVWEYNHDNGCSITGGFVYRGSAIPDLSGHYLFGDYCTRGINGFAIDDAIGTQREIAGDLPAGVTAFGEGVDGEILAGLADGSIYRLVAGSNTATFTAPQTLSQHPCFADAAAQQLSESVIPYSVNSALWSDGADKSRFVALPDGTTIDVDADGDMVFPVGSVLIKNFYHGTQLLETRFMMHHSSGWAGYSYEWNDDGTDATLSTTAHTRVIDDNYTHVYPSPSQCLECHTTATHFVLGVETAQLNRDHIYPSANISSTGITANELDTWQHIGLFSTDLTAAQRERYYPALDNSSASIEQRARAYLHSNCSGCHRPDGFPSHFDLRYDTTLADMGICNVAPTAGDLGISGAQLLTPGATATSLIYQRMARRDALQMPPLASTVVDDAALVVVGQWIGGIAGCP